MSWRLCAIVIESSLSSTTEFGTCNMTHVRSESAKRFIKLEHMQAGQSDEYKTQLVLFVRGASHCHIMLSTMDQLNGENDAFYDFGRSHVMGTMFPQTMSHIFDWRTILFLFFFGVIKYARTTNNDDGWRLMGDVDVDKTVIGDGNNNKTIIRKQRRTVISQQTNNVLSLDEPIEIKIEISSRACLTLFAFHYNRLC